MEQAKACSTWAASDVYCANSLSPLRLRVARIFRHIHVETFKTFTARRRAPET